MAVVVNGAQRTASSSASTSSSPSSYTRSNPRGSTVRRQLVDGTTAVPLLGFITGRLP
jgi:hypothetical protein